MIRKTLEQIIAKANKILRNQHKINAQVEALIAEAYELGQAHRLRDIVMELTAPDNTADELAEYAPALDMIRANWAA